MLALAAFSKWAGCYRRFQQLKQNLGLTWSSHNASEVFKRLIDESHQIEDLDDWLRQVRDLGWDYYFPIAFMRLTGLRPSEACMSLSLVAEHGSEGYYNKKLNALEHFRFDQFLRRTKNCCLSFISENLRDRMLKYGQPVSWNKLRSKIARAGLKVRLHELKKVWAITLHDHGVALESVTLLQGRMSRSVFAQFYHRPNLERLGNEVLRALNPVENQLL
jgi:hypothetical protein